MASLTAFLPGYGLFSLVAILAVGISTPLRAFVSLLILSLFCVSLFRVLLKAFPGSGIQMPETQLDPLPESDDPLDFQVRFPARQ